MLESIVVDGIDVPRLDGVSLAVDDGEFMAVIGPSGSGKTTVLRVIGGLERPASGDVLLGGVSVLDREPYQRDIAMVFQRNALIPFRSVRRNVSFPLEVRRMGSDEIDMRVGAESRAMTIERYLERMPNQLGAGHQQLAQAARALVRRPSALLLDEPLARVDPRLRIEIRNEIKFVAQGYGVTTLYATNDPTEAMALGDRIAVLDHGRIMQVGTPDDIYRRPVDRFVAEFVGTVPMSIIPVTATSSEIVTPAGGLPSGGWASSGVTTMGVRPEDWEIVPSAGLSGTVGRCENHGDHWYVSVDLSGTEAIVRVDGTPPTTGGTIEIWARRYHLFDRDGRRVGSIGA